MQSKSIAVSSIEELKTTLANIRSEDFQPTVAIAFSSPDFDFHNINAIFRDNNIELIGCTSAGEISNNTTLINSLSILFLEMDLAHFKVFEQAYENKKADRAAAALGEMAKNTFTNPGILVYSSGVTIDGESIVNNIKRIMKRDIPIYGGLAADNFRQIATHTYTSDSLRPFGIVALIIDTDAIEIKGLAFSGWNELGKWHTVTKADANVLFEIDGKPALDMFRRYFGNLEFQAKEGGEELFTIPGQYPLKITRPDGNVIMRSTLIYDFKNSALILAGAVREGDIFKFCPTPNFQVVDKTIEEYQKFSKEVAQVDALIMTSCAGRQYSFGPMFDDEVEGIYNIWKKPMVGYMSYGEIGSADERNICEFHNETCSLVTLKEK
ncbi:MAG: FIST N-terminal domain-containing protein [Chitinophagales bacterium]